MKKIIFIFSLAILFAGSNAFAANQFNGASYDCRTLAIGNATTNTGAGNPCWPLGSVNANPGDTINVRVYYHNTSSTTADNVRVSLNPSSQGPASQYTFSGQISSNQGSLNFSPVTLSLSSSQTLSFVSAHWYQNKSNTASSFLNGQSGREALSGSLYLGSQTPGDSTISGVVFVFRVGSSYNPNPNPNPNPPYYPPYNPPQNNPCRIDSFRASDDYIDEGDRVVFYWDTTNCSYTTLTGISGSMNADGSRSTYPDYSRNYCLTAYGNGTDQECIYIDVDDYRRDYSDLEVDTNNATNIGASYATLNGYIDPDDTYAYRWFRYGTSSSSLNRTTNRVNHGYNASSFSAYISGLSPNTRYYFQAVGENNNGEIEYGQTRNFNTNAEIINESNTSAVTTVATGLTTNSATLNGLILNNENLNTSAYFEYGKTVGLGLRTSSKSLGTGSSLASFDPISGLSANTIYYYRIVGQNGNGTAYGDIKIFRTLTGTVTPPVNPGTPKTPAEALASIDISNRYEIVRKDDVIDYTITYKNTGKTTLKNSILQAYLPQEVMYTNSSRGSYNQASNELVVYLEDLKPGEDGVIYMQGQVISLPSNYPQIATTAMLVYTNEKNAQENVLDTVLNRAGEVVRSNTNLAASAFFAWLGSLSLCFWLFLIILILLAILFSRLYRKEKVYTKYYPPEPPNDIPTHTT